MSISENRIVNLIKLGRTEDVLEFLILKVQDVPEYSEQYKQFILLRGRFENLRNKTKKGVISNADINLETNQINNAVLELYFNELSHLVIPHSLKYPLHKESIEIKEKPLKLKEDIFIFLWLKRYKLTTLVILILLFTLLVIFFQFIH